ncbi:MAG: TonB family protein [Woeseiaceae bacterium]|nr:TonB family protein [Woeseiaceae bacterium]
MALDPIKTQVLILHSEQSALDTLSSGIDDRYTVHCATSGTEALNTLGDTPIHVIVSAQDLPGMSGVEALREAKKRSPETIGILLAGTNDEGLEALVGDKEIFKIVRGGISSDELVKLIDNATQQMRLLALAESANDTAAAPDETGEHIVMETSENGSTIISDGTASLPKLDAQKIAANQAIGADAVDVLVLSKDEDFVATIKESSRGMHNVRCATTLAQAEEALTKHSVGVAVIDAAMVGTKVEKLTVHLRNRKQRLVTIVAGRRDDGEMLMDLINRGRVYRFLLKPVSPGRARLAVEASVKHHLEAPDAAFKMTNAAAPAAPAAKPAAKPAPAAPKAAAKAPEKPKQQAPQPKKTEVPAKKPEPSPGAIQVSVDDGLSMPFDSDDSSFVETVTGLVGKIGGSLKSDDSKAPQKKPDSGPAEPPPGDTDGSAFGKPKLLAVAAAAVLAMVAGGVWMFIGSDDVSPADTARVATPAGSDDVAPAAAEPVERQSADDLLDEARLARDAGQIIYPAGGSALDFYVRASKADPEDATIAAELAATIDQAFSLAETAMLERRTDDAAAALDRVRDVDSDNPRLGFLTAQLQQMQLRRLLDDARVAIRDARFQDAQTALTRANALGVVDSGEIDAVSADLATARSAQRVEDVLAQAADRLEQGLLIEPANDNARYFYELVLSNEPGNAVAQQGLVVVASKLVLQARTEIDRGAFDEAEALLDEARLLDPNSADLEAATAAVSGARNRIAADARRQRQAREAAAQAEAERLAALQEAEEQRRALAAAAAAEKASAPAESTAAAADSGVPAETSQQTADDPVESQVAALEVPQLEPEYRAPAGRDVAEPSRGAVDSPVAVSSLTRTRYVAPKYPRAAERRSQSGWVDVVFVVTTEGTTSKIEVIGSEPGDLFVNAATRAVEKWEFEPVIENGQLVEKRAGVRMMFAIE